jgi:predicted  nucleic acid-binding Zn-ribbon protein
MPTSENEPSQPESSGTEQGSDGVAPQLTLLLKLQELDLSLDRLAYRNRELPERTSFAEISARLAEQTARVVEAQRQRDKLSSQQEALDQRSEAVGARIATIEQRLHSRRAGSYRDEQTMGEEVTSLTLQRREIEDQEIEVMEALEPLDQELTDLSELASQSLEELTAVHDQLAIAAAAIEDEVATIRAAREQLAVRVGSELLASYERLKAKLGGIGAARLVGGVCSGCHLHVPPGELHRLRQAGPDAVGYCDQCGRILVLANA